MIAAFMVPKENPKREYIDRCPNCGADMRSTDCTKTATADEEREVLNVRAWLENGADMSPTAEELTQGHLHLGYVDGEEQT